MLMTIGLEMRKRCVGMLFKNMEYGWKSLCLVELRWKDICEKQVQKN